MSDEHLRLFRMWSLGMAAGRTPLASKCLVCDKGQQLMSCPVCLLKMHETCGDVLALCQRRLMAGGGLFVNQLWSQEQFNIGMTQPAESWRCVKCVYRKLIFTNVCSTWAVGSSEM